MSQAYFLFPGLLLPEEARPNLSTETLAVADRLSSAVKGNVVRQTLVAGRDSPPLALFVRPLCLAD